MQISFNGNALAGGILKSLYLKIIFYGLLGALWGCGEEGTLREFSESAQTGSQSCDAVKIVTSTQAFTEPRPGARPVFSVSVGEIYQVLQMAHMGIQIKSGNSVGWIRQQMAQCYFGNDGGADPGGDNPIVNPGNNDQQLGECLYGEPSQWPVPNARNISQGFRNPVQYMSCGFHTGIDIGDFNGRPVVASGPGVVVHVGPMWLNGPGVGRGPYSIIIHHGGGLYSTYGHNSASHVSVGNCVQRGQTIASVGNLGYSDAPHLHYEVISNTRYTESWQNPFVDPCNKYRNPSNYFRN